VSFEGGQVAGLAVYGHAIADAPPATDGAPYPLVVTSHAFDGFRQMLFYMAEHLASHGFVVIAADHRDNFGAMPEPFHAVDEYRRPDDVTRLIDFAAAISGVDESLANRSTSSTSQWVDTPEAARRLW
jgi:predicted dienelactone hydrolase